MKHVFLLPYFVIVLLTISACTTVKKADKLLSDDEYREKHCHSYSTKDIGYPSVAKEYIFNICNVNGSSVLFFSIPKTNEILEKEIFPVSVEELYPVKSRCFLNNIDSEKKENINNSIYEFCYTRIYYTDSFGFSREVVIKTPLVKVINPESIEGIEELKGKSPWYKE